MGVKGMSVKNKAALKGSALARALAIRKFMDDQPWSDDDGLTAMAHAAALIINKAFASDEEERDYAVAGFWLVLDAFCDD
jgi:hypothetical protein